MRKFLKILLVVLMIIAIIFFGFVASYFDKSANTVSSQSSNIQFSKEYLSIPFVADLHCDALLWNRDFFKKHDYGHVDLPRMQAANMAFQAFTIVSKTPRGQNIDSNDDKTDNIAILSFGQLQPIKNWFSIKERALWQANQLYKFAEKSNGDFRVISSKNQLSKFILDRVKNKKLTGGMLGLEGAHCLEKDLKNLDEFYKAGIRYIGITHFFDNEWAGSAHGINKKGLTLIGKKLIQKMDSLHIIIDIAHSSTNTIDDILVISKRPIIVSHTGVKGVCNNQRNLSDKHILAIGQRNGLIGIGLWETAVCGTDAAATAKSIKYVVDKIGVDKVSLGSDFDGAIKTHFDVTGLPLIMEALTKEGFNQNDIEKIMGGNIRDFLLRNLPEN